MKKRTMWIVASLMVVFTLLPSIARGQESVAPHVVPMPNHNQLLSAHVRVLFQNKEGYMWYGMKNDGLYRDDGYQLVSFRSDFLHPDIQMNNNIMCLCEDSINRLWVGTKRGLYILDKKDYTIHPTGDATLQIWTMDAVKATTDSIFAYANKHLLVYDLNGNCVRQEEVEKNPLVTQSRYKITDYRGNTWSIDDDGIVSVEKYDVIKLKEVDLTTLPLYCMLPVSRSGLSSEHKVHAVWGSKDGTKWIGTSQGVFKTDPDNPNAEPEQVGPNFGVVNTLTPAADGSIYIDTEWQGLIGYNNETIAMHDTTLHNAIDLFLDGDNLWVTTADGKLLLYDVEHWTNMDKSQECLLFGDVAQGVMVVDKKVWVLFNRRIMTYLPQQHIVRNIFPGDMNPEPKFFRRLYTDGDKKVYVECEKNTYEITLHLDSLRKSTKIVFSGYETNLGKQCVGYDTHEIELRKEERNVHLFFTTLDHMNTEHVRFAYQMEGDSVWTYLPFGKNEVFLSGLTNGEHVLQVMTTNAKGQWNQNIYTLTLDCAPYWWESIWFYIGAILLAIFLIYFTFWLGRKTA